MKKETENQASKKLRSIFYNTCLLLLIFVTKVNAVNFYWVGGTGNWFDFANHWATTSGGNVFHVQAPSVLDDVYFDNNSSLTQPLPLGSMDSILIDAQMIDCKNFHFSFSKGWQMGFFNNGSVNNIRVLGSVDVIQQSSLFFEQSAYLELRSNQATNTIKGSNLHLFLYGFNGVWSLADSLTNAKIIMQEGTLVSNNFSMGIDSLKVGAGCNIYLGSSYVYNSSAQGANIFIDDLAGAVDIDSTIIDLFPGSFYHNNEVQNSIIEAKSISVASLHCKNYHIQNIKVTGITSVLFLHIDHCEIDHAELISPGTMSELMFASTSSPNAENRIHYCSLDQIASFGGSFGVFSPNNSFQQLEVDTLEVKSFGIQINIEMGDTLKINNSFLLYANTILNTYSANLPSYIRVNLGIVCADSLILTNINAIGGATFYAGTHSIDQGGNSGWQFTNCAGGVDYYWVGGTGNWNDFANHWATTSGGTTFHTGQPGANDDVYFDANSFTGEDTVNINVTSYCKNFTCFGFSDSIYFKTTTSPGGLNINGNFSCDPYGIIGQFGGGGTGVSLTGNTGNCTINTNGSSVSTILITGNATFNLLSDLWLSGFDITGAGVFNTNNFNITTLYNVQIASSGTVNLGTSTFDGNTLLFNSTNGTLNSQNAKIKGLTISANYQCTFDSVYVISGGTIMGSLSCNNLMSQGLCHLSTLSSPFTQTHIRKIESGGVDLVGKGILIDTLITTVPGGGAFFQDTVVINNQLQIAGDALNYSPFSGGVVSMPTGTVCLDYLNLQNSTVIGGATFYAGIYSNDLGGNSGWNFTSCAAVGDVWPGDANYDLTADNNDVLNIGIAYGNTGPMRAGASLAWVAQPATDWGSSFANGADHKHADTNGDGVVDNNDTTAISINYGLIHPARYGADLINSLVDPPLYLSALSDTLAEGDSVEVTISLGSAALPVTDLYGLAFTINFDNTILDTTYIDFDFTGCWIGMPGLNLLPYTYQRSADGAIDVAITRTDQLDTIGFGYVGKFGSVIVDNVGARMASGNFMNTAFTISNVTAIHFNETLIPLAASGDSIVIDTAGTTGIISINNLYEKVVLYPNPASDKLMVRTGNVKLISIEIINSMGNVILQQSDALTNAVVNTSVLSQGIYMIKLQTENGTVIKKFQVVKRNN